MKGSLRFGILTAVALLIVLGLAGCGSSGSIPAAGSFAYLQVNNSVPGVSPLQRHSALSHSHAARIHTPGLRANTSTDVDIQTGDVDIHVYDVGTGVDTPLTGSTGIATNQSYEFNNVQLSNDGTKLLFDAQNTEGYAQIYIADAKLKTITQLTGLSGDDVTSDHFDAALSADGTQVAFDDNRGNLYTMPEVAGGTQTTVIASGWGYAEYPAFTPDGKSLVFDGEAGQAGSNPYAIYSVAIFTGAPIGPPLQLSNATEFDVYPTVSPDGTHVAFERASAPTATTSGTNYNSAFIVNENIAVIGIAGESRSPATIVTTDNKSWQPMYLGSKILYLSWAATGNDTDNNDNIYLINGDGSSVIRITNTAEETCFNWWAADEL